MKWRTNEMKLDSRRQLPAPNNLNDPLRYGSTKDSCYEATNTAQRNDIKSLKWAPGIKLPHIQTWLSSAWRKCSFTWGTAAPHSRRASVWGNLTLLHARVMRHLQVWGFHFVIIFGHCSLWCYVTQRSFSQLDPLTLIPYCSQCE